MLPFVRDDEGRWLMLVLNENAAEPSRPHWSTLRVPKAPPSYRSRHDVSSTQKLLMTSRRRLAHLEDQTHYRKE